MPIYKFICDDCDKPSEWIIKYEEIDTATCRHCGSKNLTRAFTTNASYKILGPNGASTTPKPFRGGRRE